MEAIVLVGGLGTRLGSLTKHIPKPMLPIRGVPFLERLLISLKANGFNRVVLAVGYKREIVESYFCDTNDNLPEIVYSVEMVPMGTGGAIIQALQFVSSDLVFVFNGDSYVDLNYSQMQQQHITTGADITIASYFIEPADRYGVMKVFENKSIVSFQEKGAAPSGLINAGVYLIGVSKLKSIMNVLDEEQFSFEETVLADNSLGLKKYHFQTNGYFLDIGVPTDYERAQQELFIK